MNYFIAPGMLCFRNASDEMKIQIIKDVIEKHFGLCISGECKKGDKDKRGHARKLFCYLCRKHTDLLLREIACYIDLDHSTVVVHEKSLSGKQPQYIIDEIEAIKTKLFEWG